MYPLAVDTLFTTGSTYIEPRMTGGRPETLYLSPEVWDVYWAVQRSAAGTNGFEKALVPAQMVTYPTFDNLLVKDNRFILNSAEAVSLGAGETPNMIIYTIPPEETQNGKSGSVNFNLEYMPFNLGDKSFWSGFHSNYFNLTQGAPVWIIRNGVNDLAQDGNTNFSDFGTIAGANANGGIQYVIGMDPDFPEAQALSLSVDDGQFVANADTTTPTIRFDTHWSPATGKANVWYAVVKAGSQTAPETNEYIGLAKVSVVNDHQETIEVDPSLVALGYDVYVVITKDGYRSLPEIIAFRTDETPDLGYDFGVEDLDLSGSITPPVTDMAPDLIFTSPSTQYTASSAVTWSPTSDTTYEASTVYTATVTLTAASGYNFASDTSFTYNGASSVTTTIQDATRKKATVTITFPATGSGSFSGVIDLSSKIDAPVEGELPHPQPNPSQGAAPFYDNGIGYSCRSVVWSRDGDPYWDGLQTTFSDLSSYWYTVTVTLESLSINFSALTEDDFICHDGVIAITNNLGSEITLAITFPKPAPSP
jgi:hypothetical protein